MFLPAGLSDMIEKGLDEKIMKNHTKSPCSKLSIRVLKNGKERPEADLNNLLSKI